MGARSSKCLGCAEEDTAGPPPTYYIVPDQDPLKLDRIQRCDASEDFQFRDEVIKKSDLCNLLLAKNRATKETVAVKRFPKTNMVVNPLRNEAAVHLQMDHANICRLLHIYESAKVVDMVFEFCGPDLQMRLSEQKIFQEVKAAEMALQMLQAIDYLHMNSIAHRNLKLEHWLCGTRRLADQLKLSGFKHAKKLKRRDDIMVEDVGTLAYACPELFSCKYTCKCDIWSLGIICYMLVIGKPPFYFPENDVRTKMAILYNEFPKDGPWKSLSGDGRQLLIQLLQKGVAQRPDSIRALQAAEKWKCSQSIPSAG